MDQNSGWSHIGNNCFRLLLLSHGDVRTSATYVTSKVTVRSLENVWICCVSACLYMLWAETPLLRGRNNERLFSLSKFLNLDSDQSAPVERCEAEDLWGLTEPEREFQSGILSAGRVRWGKAPGSPRNNKPYRPRTIPNMLHRTQNSSVKDNIQNFYYSVYTEYNEALIDMFLLAWLTKI